MENNANFWILVRNYCEERIDLNDQLDKGGVIQWTDHDSRQIAFADDLPEPVVALTRGGWLVVAGGDRIEVYSARSEKVTLHARAAGPGDRPIAILSAATPTSSPSARVTGENSGVSGAGSQRIVRPPTRYARDCSTLVTHLFPVPHSENARKIARVISAFLLKPLLASPTFYFGSAARG
jgi:hypothetical protein